MDEATDRSEKELDFVGLLHNEVCTLGDTENHQPVRSASQVYRIKC